MSRIDDIFNSGIVTGPEDEHEEIQEKVTGDFCGIIYTYGKNQKTSDHDNAANIRKIKRLHYLFENSPFIEQYEIAVLNNKRESPDYLNAQKQLIPWVKNAGETEFYDINSLVDIRFRFTRKATEYDAMKIIFMYSNIIGLYPDNYVLFNGDWQVFKPDDDQYWVNLEKSERQSFVRAISMLEDTTAVKSFVSHILKMWGFSISEDEVGIFIEDLQIEQSRIRFRKKGGKGFEHYTILKISNALCNKAEYEMGLRSRTTEEMYYKMAALYIAIEDMKNVYNSSVLWKAFKDHIRDKNILRTYMRWKSPENYWRFKEFHNKNPYFADELSGYITKYCKPDDIHHNKQHTFIIDKISRYINSEEFNVKIREKIWARIK